MNNFLDFYTAEIERRNARIEELRYHLSIVTGHLDDAYEGDEDAADAYGVTDAVKDARATLKQKGE